MDGTSAYGVSPTFSYTVSEPGAYVARGYARDALYAKASARSSPVQALPETPLTVKAVSANATEAEPGDELVWTVEAEGGSGGTRYYFDIMKDGTRVGGTTSYGASPTFAYTANEPGAYQARGWAKDAAGARAYKLSETVTVKAAVPLVVKAVTASAQVVSVGETVTWTAEAEGGRGNKTYYFDVFKNGVRVGGSAKYGTEAAFEYRATEAGRYWARGWAKDETGAKAYGRSENTVATGKLPLTVTSVDAGETRMEMTESRDATWVIEAEGGRGALSYRFELYRDGSLLFQTSDYGADNRLAYTLKTAGVYTVRGFVRDEDGGEASLLSDALTAVAAYKVVYVESNSAALVELGESIQWHAYITHLDELYYKLGVKYDLLLGGERVAGSDGYVRYATFELDYDSTVSYTPAVAGAYVLRVTVKNREVADSPEVSLFSQPIVVQSAPELAAAFLTRYNDTQAFVGGFLYRTVNATGGMGEKKYYFAVYRDGAQVWSSETYGSENWISYQTEEAGVYRVRAWVKDEAGTKVSVVTPQIFVTWITLAIRPHCERCSYEDDDYIFWYLYSDISDGYEHLYEMSYDIYVNGVRVQGSDGYVPFQVINGLRVDEHGFGRYDIRYTVRCINGDSVSGEMGLYASAKQLELEVRPSMNHVELGKSIAFTAYVDGGEGSEKYRFEVYQDGLLTYATPGYVSSNRIEYMPVPNGTDDIYLYVHCRVMDGGGTIASDTAFINSAD